MLLIRKNFKKKKHNKIRRLNHRLDNVVKKFSSILYNWQRFGAN